MACQEAVSLFQSTTGADAETAEHCLEAFEGDLDRAVSHYFDASSPPGAPPPAGSPHAASSPPRAINVDSDDEQMAALSAREVRQAASLCETDRATRLAAQRRNQGHLEEEDALQQALAASRMAAGGGGSAEPSAAATASRRSGSGGASTRPQSSIVVSSDSEEDEEFEPEVDSDVEMDTEEEYLRKLAAAHLASAPRTPDEAGAGPSNTDGASAGPFDGGFGGFPGGRDVGLPDMPAGVDVEEARMLEAAMLGIPYTGRMDFGSGGGTNGRANGAAGGGADGQPLSPGVRAQRLLRQEQNDAYQESLRADRQRAAAEEAKQVAHLAAAKAESEAKAQEAEERRIAAELHAEQLAAKRAVLPGEPPAGSADSTTVLIKLPDGTRLSRRFPKSAALERLYDFVDSNGPGAEGPSSSCQAGTYLLVSPRPRKVHQSTSLQTLGGAGFERQEMLMLEPLA